MLLLLQYFVPSILRVVFFFSPLNIRLNWSGKWVNSSSQWILHCYIEKGWKNHIYEVWFLFKNLLYLEKSVFYDIWRSLKDCDYLNPALMKKQFGCWFKLNMCSHSFNMCLSSWKKYSAFSSGCRLPVSPQCIAMCAWVPAQKLLSAHGDIMPLSGVGVTGVSEPSHHSHNPGTEGCLVQPSSTCCVSVSLYGPQGQAWSLLCVLQSSPGFPVVLARIRCSCRHRLKPLFDSI